MRWYHWITILAPVWFALILLLIRHIIDFVKDRHEMEHIDKILKNIVDEDFIGSAKNHLTNNGFNIEKIDRLDTIMGKTFICAYAVFFDDTNRKIAFVDAFNKTFFISGYDQLISYEVIKNKSQEISGSSGNALVGGLLLGTTGAIIGASSTKEITEAINNLQVIIRLNDFQHSHVCFDIIGMASGRYAQTNTMVKTVFSQINSLISTLEYIKKNHNNKKGSNE